ISCPPSGFYTLGALSFTLVQFSGGRSIGQNEDTEDLISLVPPNLVAKEDADKDTEEYRIESVRGVGEEAVYVYYYTTYKESALAAGKDHWLCKIGRTDRLPRIRISEQTTGIPEQPVIGSVIKTDDSRAVETVVKNVLGLRGQWSEDSPGSEWFVTSPDDVLQIIKLLVPKFNTDMTTEV
ncbi:MAG: GIY-YIG nuclease family protein, partial [Acidobacteriia bacterium]|nr:GIY-YIG nuclease family protein [Terriglobia bacterium]